MQADRRPSSSLGGPPVRRGSPAALFLLATGFLVGALFVAAGCGSGSGTISVANAGSSGIPSSRATSDQVTRGRYLAISLGCSDCHNRGKDDPTDPQWLAGFVTGGQQGIFQIGPFTTYAANLTPDVATGLGSVSDRQVYNALKFGLDPKETPDVVISGTTPGQGNFPAAPHYLAPPMPWPAFRHLSDDDLWAIVAYVKHGIKPVSNTVPDSQGPPDNWAGSYSPAAVGPAVLPSFPTGNEQFNP